LVELDVPPVKFATVRTTPALLMYVLFVTNEAKRASVPGAGSPPRATRVRPLAEPT
jgi:hypothetical protein